MTALRRKLWRDLAQMRGQTLAIAMVLAAGLATLVMSLSTYRSLADTRERFYGEYRFADVFARVERAPWPLLEDIAALPGVQQAEGRVVAAVNLELDGYDDAVTGLVVSLPDATQAGLNRIFLREGRLPDPRRSDEAVVGEAFAQAHGLHPGDGIVAIINGRRQALRITGIGLSPEFIYQMRPGDAFPDFERYGVLWMQREPLAAAFDLDGAFNDVVLAVHRDASVPDVIDALDDLLDRHGGLGAYGRDLQSSHRFLDEELTQLRVMARLFPLVFLSVSAFLLNIVIGRLVNTQREQIAVLKAFGYTRAEVARHYAGLVLAMVSVGLPPGLALGAWTASSLSGVYAEFYRFPYLQWTLPADVLAIAVAFTLAVAALGTFTGLARVFALAPAQAMRPEAPVSFRPTLLERLGLSAWLDPAARMVLRNLERRPLRTASTVLGIGLAVGILVMTRFQSSAIDEMIDVQLGFAQRDDLAVTFTQPTSERAAQELLAIPGVLAVEPFRQSAVMLRNGHREYRTSLLGLQPRGDLKRLVGTSLQPIVLPREGLVITDHLATMLGVAPGDTLDVEFLDGRRETRPLRIAGLSREYLGVGAYLHLDALHRLRGDGRALSGAWLRIEPSARAGVVKSLRETPRVAAASDRSAMISAFRNTMAEGILMFTLVATAMGASIAIGVVYNSARITLSERGRELASLRVLGYTRAEVRGLVMGELGALTLLALLPGFALGYGLSWLLVQGFESDLYRIPLVIAPAGLGLAALVVIGATAVSGALVRRRLDELDLVAVLKTKE